MLFREDLEAIVKLFEGFGAGPNSLVFIEDDETQYPSLDELKVHKGKRVVALRIINPTVGIKLQLRKWSPAEPNGTPVLSTTKITDEADLAFYRMKEFLESKRHPAEYWLGKVLPVVSLIILAWSIFPIYSHRNDPPPIRPALFGLLALCALSVAGLIIRASLKTSFGFLVSLEPRHASFLRRNRDSVILSLTFFALGIVSAVIFQYLK